MDWLGFYVMRCSRCFCGGKGGGSLFTHITVHLTWLAVCCAEAAKKKGADAAAAAAASSDKDKDKDKTVQAVPVPEGATLKPGQLQLFSNPLFAKSSESRVLSDAELHPDALPSQPPTDALYQQYMAQLMKNLKDVTILSATAHQARIAPKTTAFTKRSAPKK